MKLLRVWQARSGARILRCADLARVDLIPFAEAPEPVGLDDCEGGLPERELLHLHNLLVGAGRHLLMAGREPPARWPVRLPDLRSRLSAVTAVAIAPPDDTLLAAILVKLFSDRQLRVDREVIDYLLARMERSFGAAERLVGRLDALGLALGRRITVALARRAIEEEEKEG